MPAFNDAQCPKCRRKFGWCGEFKDCPPCPKCGHQIDPASWDDAEAEMQKFRDLLAARKRKKGDDPRCP